MELVVDFQAFVGDTGKYVLKELAIIAVEKPALTHLFVMPPFSYYKLSPKRRREAEWLVRNYHGIPWEEGYVTVRQAITFLKKITRNANVLLVKGREKAEFLRKVTGKPVQDLFELGCPRASDLIFSDVRVTCFFPPHFPEQLKNNNFACSLFRVQQFRSWYKTYVGLNLIHNNWKTPAPRQEFAHTENEYPSAEAGFDVPDSLCSRECVRVGPTSLHEDPFTRQCNR